MKKQRTAEEMEQVIRKHQTNPILLIFFDLATFVAKMPWEEGNTARRIARRYKKA
jgi:hypothetical protein